MKKILNKILMLTILCIYIFASTCLASGPVEVIRGVGSSVLSAVLWVGYAISLGMVVFIGIKYVISSADGKANMKSAVVNWVIGAFLVFACTSVAGFIINAAGLGTGGGLASAIIDAAK